MNKGVIFLVVVCLVAGIGFFVMRSGEPTERTEPTEPTEQIEQTELKDQIEVVEHVDVVDKPKVNLGLQLARPRWLAATEVAMGETRKDMVVAAKNISDAEKGLREKDEAVAALHVAMKDDYSKYRSALEGADLYKVAKEQEREATLRCDKIAIAISKAQAESNTVVEIEALEADLAKVCDELVRVSIEVSEVEAGVRATDQSVARAYAAMATSRRIYRESLKSDEAYMSAKGVAEKHAARYQDLIERREKLKKEIGNE